MIEIKLNGKQVSFIIWSIASLLISGFVTATESHLDVLSSVMSFALAWTVLMLPLMFIAVIFVCLKDSDTTEKTPANNQ